MGAPPAWARTLIDDVLTAEGIDPGSVSVTWRRARWRQGTFFRIPPSKYSAGHAWVASLTISAGSDRVDQRLSVLHELAHVIRCRQDLTAHHDETFWLIFWRLFLTYGRGITNKYALWREGRYMIGALTTAQSLGIRGAQLRLQRERRERAAMRRPRR